MANPINRSVIQLWTSITAANGVPSSESDGFPLPRDWNDTILTIASTAGTTPTVTAKLWVFQGGTIDLWLPLGIDPTGDGDGTLAGIVNEGISINAYDGANTIRHVEAIANIQNFARVYLELTALSGSPTLNAWLTRRRES